MKLVASELRTAKATCNKRVMALRTSSVLMQPWYNNSDFCKTLEIQAFLQHDPYPRKILNPDIIKNSL